MTRTMYVILGLAFMALGILGLTGLMPVFTSLCENWRDRSWWSGLLGRNVCRKDAKKDCKA
jgi:hypothetical protein